MNKIGLAGTALCLPVVSTLLVGRARSHEVRAHVNTGSFDVPAMDIAFTPTGDVTATRTVLPDGKPGLTRYEALDLAGKHAGASIDPRQIPDVEYIARYGIFSDTQVTDAHATGAAVHPLADRPAWIVK